MEALDKVVEQLLTLDRLVGEEYLRDRGVTKFLAHCNSGIKKSGFFVVLYRVIKETEVRSQF